MAPGLLHDAAGRRCTARTHSGARCRHWATRDTTPPLCWLHAYPDAHPGIRHGFYRAQRAAEAAFVAGRDRADAGGALTVEIALLRLRLRGLLAYLGRPGLTVRQRLAAARLLLRGMRKVGRLLRAQAALAADATGAKE